MQRITCLLLGLAFAAQTSFAGVSGEFQIVTQDGAATPPAGFVASNLVVTADTDWLAANLIIDLTAGSINQDAFVSGFGPPSQALANVIPAVLFDTFVTGSGWLAGGSPSSAGGAVDLGGSPTATFSTSKIDLNWFTTNSNDIGTFPIGRFVLSNNATGTFKLRLDSMPSEASARSPLTTPFILSGTINNGSFTAVPEVNSLALGAIGLAAAGFVARRRRAA